MRTDIIIGLLIGISISVTVVYTSILYHNKSQKPESKFQVVDTYENCEVIRYSPEGGAKYAYFLNCKTP